MQYSIPVNNARLDAIETAIGTTPKLRLYTGAKPVTCASSESGTLLCEIALPSDWMAAASGAQKLKSGTWSGNASAAGTIGHYRIYDSAGTTCHNQGTASDTGSPDMVVDNAVVANAQAVVVNTFQLNAANT